MGGEKIGCQCRTMPADATKITDWVVQDEVYTKNTTVRGDENGTSKRYSFLLLTPHPPSLNAKNHIPLLSYLLKTFSRNIVFWYAIDCLGVQIHGTSDLAPVWLYTAI